MDDRKNLKGDIKTQVHRAAGENRDQNLSVENRQKTTVSGVLNVYSFNEAEIVVETIIGVLTIKGSMMHMSKLNLETGDLIIEGNFDSCSYSEKQDLKTKGSGFLSKMFR